MTTSLSKFCKDYNLAKSSVYRRCQELNLDVKHGLDERTVRILKSEFDVHQDDNQLTSKRTTLVVEAGNHSITLADPTLPQTYTLESLRSGEAISFEDPLAIAHQFLEASDLILAGMDADIRQRQQKLKTTQQAKDAVAQKRQKLELEARLYQLQTEQLDDALSSETASLQDQLKELQRLGKPSSAS